jgi:RNA polymerase sigma-70 factor (ECF subfamily)
MVSETTVARAVTGDAEAFEAIVVWYEPRIYRFLYALLRDRELARDLTQETFLSAHSNIRRAGADLKLAAWLYTIAKNHAFSALRRRRLVSWLPLPKRRKEGEAEEELDVGQGGDLAAEVVEKEALREALARLNPEYRALLLLTAEGFSYGEIGRMMGLKATVVRQRVYRARERLREVYRDLED